MIGFVLGCFAAWGLTSLYHWREHSRLNNENKRLEGLAHHRLEIIADLSQKQCKCSKTEVTL